MGSRPVAMLAAAVLALAAGGCHSDDDAADPARTTTTQSPESEVESAYLAYWDMLGRLAAAPDPDDPEIAERASGQALSEVRAGLASQQSLGQIAQTGPEYKHTVLSVTITDDTAVLRDCAIDDSTILNEATGEKVSGGVAATGLLEASLKAHDDTWLVDNVDTLDTWDGVTTCEG